jgi:hemerythrin
MLSDGLEFGLDGCTVTLCYSCHFFGVLPSSVVKRGSIVSLRISWQPGFSVGNAILDRQHKKLLELCGRACDCLEDNSRQSVEQVHHILHDLCTYTDQHFRTEEAILEQRNCPQLAEQKEEHIAYSERLADLLFEAGNGVVDKVSLYLFLSGWWQHHILVSDMKFKAFLQDASIHHMDPRSPATARQVPRTDLAA